MSSNNCFQFGRTAGLVIIFVLPIVTSMQLNCSFFNETDSSFVANVYGCFGETIAITYPGVIIDSVEGVHKDGKTNNDTNVLRVSFKQWSYIPKGLGDNLENLEALILNYCGLQLLSKEDLEQFPNLKSLHLPNNLLTSLDSGLFQFNTKLKSFVAERNRICTIAVDIFDPVDDLEEIDLSDNSCEVVARNKKQIENLKMSIAEKSRCENEYFLETIENSSEMFSTSTVDPVASTERSCDVATYDEENSEVQQSIISSIKTTENWVTALTIKIHRCEA